MSRSYKKTLGYCDRNPFMKKVANRKVRRKKNIGNGKEYKKHTCSWNICDWKFIYYSNTDFSYLKHYPFNYTDKQILEERNKTRRK